MPHIIEDDYITDEERANTRAYAERTRQRGLEQVKVITASIPIIRQKREAAEEF